MVAPEILPALVVSVSPAFEETRTWYPTAATSSLIKIFGADGLRACEACMSPRLDVKSEGLVQTSTSPSADELSAMDEQMRGKAAPAKAAIFLDETETGVSLRIIDLRNARILIAENIDPMLKSRERQRTNWSLSQELERRQRHESITHTFVDIAVYPSQHVSLDWSEQWGDTNANVSGFTLSLFDPVIGVGGNYFRVLPKAFNIMVGAKVIMSVPTALVNAISPNGSQSLFDPTLTLVGVVRVPISTSNYAVTLTGSTNGRIGVGISLLNLSLLPFLP